MRLQSKLKQVVFLFTAVFLTFLLVIAIFEFGTHIGVFYQLPLPDDDAKFIIVCVGDSHTAGTGAPAGMDYPTQLEKLLNRNTTRGKIQVLNLRRSGNNTSTAVNRAIRFLKESPRRPDIVIFCGGFNNSWDLSDADVLPADIRKRGMKASYEYLLASSHTYRFGQITVRRLRQRLRHRFGQDALFDLAGPEDLGFLSNWIQHDLRRLQTQYASQGADMLLLTYWNSVPWVDMAYESFSRSDGVPVIDVRNFGVLGFQCDIPPCHLVAPGYHPNERGYERIAHIVAKLSPGATSTDRTPLRPRRPIIDRPAVGRVQLPRTHRCSLCLAICGPLL